MIESNCSAPEEDEAESESSEGQGKFVAMFAHESIVEVDFRNRNGKINADSEGRGAGEQANEDEQPAEELGEGGKIGGPGGKSEAGDEVSMLLKSAENLVISVSDHDGAKRKAHDKKREGLQSIEVAQAMPPEKGKHRLQQASVGRK